ncbi:MAG: oligosaccharide flippase family protein [Candidatus Nealsonbacteria bacterium]|nr:oligosaccharide flippase family protein [Candidatus Nealsonbacteria bacterium]
MKKYKEKIVRFLRWTQKYTKTDMVYLVKGGFWLTLGQIISTAVLFGLGLAYANLWDPINYGNYKYILSLVGLLNIFTLSGMGTAITQAVARGFEGSFYSAFKEKFRWGLLGSFGAVVLSGYYFYKENFKLSIPLLIAALFLPLMEASKIYLSYLSGKRKFEFNTRYKNLSEIISAAVIIITLFFTNNLFLVIGAYFTSHALMNFFFYNLVKAKFQPNEKEDPKTLPFGKQQSLISVLGNISNKLDHLLIFHYLGAMEIAIYSFSIMLPEQIRGVLKNVQTLSLPKLANKSRKEIKENIFGKIWQLFLFSAIIAIVYVVTAPFIYNILFPKYEESILYSQLLSIYILTNPGLSIAVLEAKIAKKERLALTLTTRTLEIVLLFFSIINYGLIGAIATKIIIGIITFLLSLWLVKKI